MRRGSAKTIILISFAVIILIAAFVTPIILIGSFFNGSMDKPTGEGVAASCTDLGYAHIDGQTEILSKINANRSVYEASANKVGIPWEMLAAIHYREHKNANDNPDNGEGPYQLHSLKGSNPNHPALSNFEAASDFVAEALKNDYSKRYQSHTNTSLGELGPGSEHELIQGTFWAYNGLRGTLGESPYVWNFYDAEHSGSDGEGMKWPSEHSLAGRTDASDGAFTVYSFLHYGASFEGGKITAKTCTESSTIAGSPVLPNSDGLSQPIENFKEFLPLRPHHKGYKSEYVAVDIPVVTGTRLYAIGSGQVYAVLTKGDCGRGIGITLDNAQTGSMKILYCHMQEVDRSLRTGGKIKSGQLLGTSNNTGHSTGPHLHIQGEGGFLKEYPPPGGAKDSKREQAWRKFLTTLAE